ncbi:MAG: tagaturonate reductase, partial [Candidatus Scatosoma sp.]
MIKIVQFGEGNFLRTFAEAYFDTLNKEGAGEYGIHIVKPISGGSLEKFERQNNAYHIVLRGVKNGKATEEIYKIDAVKSVFSPFEKYAEYLALARDCEVKIVVSNTTEAGICFSESDKFGDFETATYPAKLTKWLYERYRAGLGGVYILPVELIENNADELFRCVEKYIALWHLPEAFGKWNAEENFYCNTLVDRIVSGY